MVLPSSLGIATHVLPRCDPHIHEADVQQGFAIALPKAPISETASTPTSLEHIVLTRHVEQIDCGRHSRPRDYSLRNVCHSLIDHQDVTTLHRELEATHIPRFYQEGDDEFVARFLRRLR